MIIKKTVIKWIKENVSHVSWPWEVKDMSSILRSFRTSQTTPHNQDDDDVEEEEEDGLPFTEPLQGNRHWKKKIPMYFSSESSQSAEKTEVQRV